MMRRSTLGFLSLIFLSLQPPAFAQRASLTGTVQDSTGAAVPQATVTVRNTATSASRTASTDRSGAFEIASLAPGAYNVRIEKDRFKTVEYAKVLLTVDQVQNLETLLVPSTVREKVTVTSEPAPIDLNDAQIGSVVTSEQIENLPSILRDPYQLILLSPGGDSEQLHARGPICRRLPGAK